MRLWSAELRLTIHDGWSLYSPLHLQIEDWELMSHSVISGDWQTADTARRGQSSDTRSESRAPGDPMLMKVSSNSHDAHHIQSSTFQLPLASVRHGLSQYG